MSFLYQNTVDVYRPVSSSAAGISGYEIITDGALILSQLPASVQIDHVGTRSSANLPADAVGQPYYRVMLPFIALPSMGMIRERDVLVDEIGRRLMVLIVEWTFIGTQLRTQLLET